MLSGVTVVAVMTAPYPCPHGRCLYCPGGLERGTPQSYIDRSPAVMRALKYGFDPYYQVRDRIAQYFAMGHIPSKVELIVMGGTFPAMPLDYQEWFVAQSLEALNRFPRDKPRGWVPLERAIRRNERARIRCVGLTIETRPDWCKERHVDRFLYLAATRVELGVQSIYDDVLRRVRRGHGVEDTIEATRILKDAGYKVVYHLMPGLPGSDPDRDYEMFVEIFDNPDFRPDMLKIYPTLVMPGTGLYRMWAEGRFVPYTDEEVVELVAKVKAIVPPYTRIMRIQRDIPVDAVAAGLTIGNLREVVKGFMAERGLECRCIRCREVGRKLTGGEPPDPREASMVRYYYEASRGYEVFISLEDRRLDAVYGIARLRIPSVAPHRRELGPGSSLLRELHVYGPQVPVGRRGGGYQHRGIGERLLQEAERVALEEFDAHRMFVISGVGAREYYRRRGYRRYPGSFYMYRRLG